MNILNFRVIHVVQPRVSSEEKMYLSACELGRNVVYAFTCSFVRTREKAFHNDTVILILLAERNELAAGRMPGYSRNALYLYTFFALMSLFY